MINSKAELFRWGPIPGRPLYVSYFTVSIAETFAQKYRYAWPEILFYFREEYMTFICEYPALREVGKKHMKNGILNDHNFEKVKQEYQTQLQKLHAAHSQITALKTLSNQEFTRIQQHWQDAYLSFWDPAMVPELANWGGEQMLKEELQKIVPKGTEFITAMEKLSAPLYLSFYQEEELDLLRLKQQEKSSSFKKKLPEHTQKYSWIQNSYAETKVLDGKYFLKKMKELDSKNIKEEIRKIVSFPAKAQLEKEKIIQKYKLNKDIQKLAERLSYCIYWQDARKKEIFQAEHYLRLILEEIARRKKISVADLEYYWGRELENLLHGIPVPIKKIAQRKQKFLGHYDRKLRLVTNPTEFDTLVNPFLEKKMDTNITEIKGTVASLGTGKVQGKVKIVLHPREWQKVKRGDILVAPMTSPEYIVAMRRAVAIVTDEGGLTSHAAIVSRELGKPCIVGTSIATKVLKDGEKIEVDPAKGVIKKIQ